MIYFAYGMNMDATYMRGAPLGRAVLRDWRLVFRGGYADVEPEAGDQVLGVLWDVDRALERVLDQREGYPHFYDKRTVTVRGPDGTATEAVVYHMADPSAAQERLPSFHYLMTVIRGRLAAGWTADDLIEPLGAILQAEGK